MHIPQVGALDKAYDQMSVCQHSESLMQEYGETTLCVSCMALHTLFDSVHTFHICAVPSD